MKIVRGALYEFEDEVYQNWYILILGKIVFTFKQRASLIYTKGECTKYELPEQFKQWLKDKHLKECGQCKGEGKLTDYHHLAYLLFKEFYGDK